MCSFEEIAAGFVQATKKCVRSLEEEYGLKLKSVDHQSDEESPELSFIEMTYASRALRIRVSYSPSEGVVMWFRVPFSLRYVADIDLIRLVCRHVEYHRLPMERGVRTLCEVLEKHLAPVLFPKPDRRLFRGIKLRHKYASRAAWRYRDGDYDEAYELFSKMRGFLLPEEETLMEKARQAASRRRG